MQQLIWNHLHTVDHVAVSLAVRTIERAELAAVAAHTTLDTRWPRRPSFGFGGRVVTDWWRRQARSKRATYVR